MSNADHVAIRPVRDRVNQQSFGNREYFVPSKFILKLLGLRETDLNRETVNIQVDALRSLISEFAAMQRFDESFYAEYYKDIKGAQLAGQVGSPHAHFVEVGYMEGRLPRHLPFNAEWYFDHYSDLAGAYSRSDVEGLANHFFTVGYLEGKGRHKGNAAASRIVAIPFQAGDLTDRFIQIRLKPIRV